MSEATAIRKKRKKQNQTVEILKRLARNKLAMAGVIIILLMLILSVLAPVIAPYDPAAMDYTSLKAGPSAKHLLGCDHLGRDILSRLIHGAKYSLAVGFCSAMIGLFLGVFFGCIVGYYGGTVSEFSRTL